MKQGPDDVPLPDEGNLQAARAMFAGAWDIVELSGRYVAVPDGTQIVWSATIGGLVGKLRNRGAAGEAD